jgi:hypothetical protein
MIMSTKMEEKYDRLTAFLRVYALRTEILAPEYAPADAHLFVAFDARTGEASHIELAMRGITASAETEGVAARVIFGGEANPPRLSHALSPGALAKRRRACGRHEAKVTVPVIGRRPV